MTTPPPPDPLAQPVIGADPPPAGRPRRGLLGRLRRPAVGLALAAAGAAGAVAARGGSAPPDHADHADHPAPAGKPPREPSPDATAGRLDLAIRSGRFADGLKLCLAAPKELYGADPRPLAYRTAVCLEGLGRHAEAAEVYTKAADPDDGGPLWAWAALGRARCAAAGGARPAARRLLAGVFLRSARDPHVRADCLYLRAKLDLAAAGPPADPDPLDIDAVAWPPLLATVEHVLPESIDAPAGSPEPAGGPAVVVRRWWWPRGREEVTARSAGRAAAVVSAFGTAAGWRVAIDPDAAAVLIDPVAVDVEAAPLAEVLTSLTDPYDLAWTASDGVLTVRTADPVSKNWMPTASSGLRRALAADPDHPAAAAARVAVANLDLAAGRRRAAADGYRQLLADDPNAAEGVCAAYNLGLVELADGQTAAARGRFVEVIDRGRRGRWADLGAWWVGRTHLDAGDTAAARKPLGAALDGAAKAVRSAAALGLAVADLLDGEDDAARSRLRTVRFSTREAHAGTAAWLTALLRQRGTPSAGRAGELLAAVRDGGDGRPLGPAGVWLAGQAYRAAGRADRMADLYDAAAAADTRGPLAVRMTAAAADYLFELDRRGPARQRYLAVAATDPAGLGPAAELRLADLAGRDGRGAECVRRCRRVLGRPGVDPAAVVAVMAWGYEREGDHRRAAECLAGRVPPE